MINSRAGNGYSLFGIILLRDSVYFDGDKVAILAFSDFVVNLVFELFLHGRYNYLSPRLSLRHVLTLTRILCN